MDRVLKTSEKILQCTQTLIIAGGYNGFSYSDIAKVVGIRNASIHHHFPSKAILVQSLLKNYRESALAGIADMERSIPSPVAQLRVYAGHWENCIADPSSSFCVCAMLAAEMPILPEEIAAEVKAHFRMLSAWLTSVLERGEQQGSVRLTTTPRAEAEMFMGTVHGAMLSARAYEDPEIFGVVVNPVLARFVN